MQQAEEIVTLPEFVLGVFIDVLAEYGNELLMQFSCNESLQFELIMNIKDNKKDILEAQGLCISLCFPQEGAIEALASSQQGK